jgi:hypothetical protein
MNDPLLLIKSVISRVALNARGSALPLARGMLEQISHFLSAGMSTVTAFRESLAIAIHTAQVKAQYCVGTERLAIDDFIRTCVEIESDTTHLLTD